MPGDLDGDRSGIRTRRLEVDCVRTRSDGGAAGHSARPRIVVPIRALESLLAAAGSPSSDPLELSAGSVDGT